MVAVSLVFAISFYGLLLIMSFKMLSRDSGSGSVNDPGIFPFDSQLKISQARKLFLRRIGEEIRSKMFRDVDNFTAYTVERFGLKPLNNVSLLANSPVYNDVTGFIYPVTIEICSTDDYFAANRSLFVAVMSAPESFEKRQLIRNTWASHLEVQSGLMYLTGFAFIVGQSTNSTVEDGLKKESRRYEDIIQIGVMDSNLTLKVAGLLHWLHKNCAIVDFVLKVNDDVYVNVRNLVTTLATLPDPYEHPNIYGTRELALISLDFQHWTGRNDRNSSRTKGGAIY